MIAKTLVLVGIMAAAYSGWRFTARNAYESAQYITLQSDDSFEIREYPDLALATTDMTQGRDGSFGRLFEYISGENEANQKIAMTVPVFMSRSNSERMSFVLPQTVAKGRIPAPSHKLVDLATRSKGRFAVLKFSGRISQERLREAETQLRGWIVKQGFTPNGEPENAVYDPPWTPGPLRRNEVMIRIATQHISGD